MPTYRPRSSVRSYVMVTVAGRNLFFPAGQDTEVEYLVSHPDLDKTADTPYFNPALAKSGLTSSGVGDDKTIVLQSETDEVEIINNGSATLTVYREALANAPGLVVPPSSVRTIGKLKHRTSQLIIQSSAEVTDGQVCVTEMEA